MGSPWKMFTKDQGQELIDGTTSTFTSINNVLGRKFTSKTDSSKYIFLPAGGSWDNMNYAASDCYYWTTTWYRDYQTYIIMTVTGFPILSYAATRVGIPVRAIN